MTMAAMPSVIVEILPYALGVFASPLPVIVGVILLFTPRPRPTSVTYVATWVAGVTLAAVVFTLLAGYIGDHDQDAAWAPWLRVVLGLLLLAMGVKLWRGRAAEESPRWLDAVLEAGPREAVRLGVLMSAANPKELVMALGAGVVIGSSEVGAGTAVAALVVFVFVGALSVVAPLAVFLVGGDGTLERLGVAREWLQRNNAVVASIVLVALGVWLLVGGLLKVF